MDIREKIQEMKRNAIELNFTKDVPCEVGATRFGGRPDVPADFMWPVFETATYDDDEVKQRPLSFLAQFNCAELASLDEEGLLPKTGVLSFFYEMGSQRWGFDPKDAGCARVYWFDGQPLKPAPFPEELEQDYRMPDIGIGLEAVATLPSYQDFTLKYTEKLSDEEEDYLDEMSCEAAEDHSRLLGWPILIQNNITQQCELISRGHYLGRGWEQIPPEDIQYAEAHSLEEWQLLFQLGIVAQDGFELMFGDCGCIYYYIRKADLKQRRFDRVWLVLQCS